MDDQLVIDSSGAWVRKTARLIAEKPIPLPEHLGGLPRAADRSFDSIGDQHENIYTVLLDWKHCSPAQAE